MGATESLLLMEFFYLISFFSPLSNQVLQQPFLAISGYDLSIAQLILWFSFLSGVYYNLSNILAGFLGASSKQRAFLALVPYLQVYLLIYVSTFSQFYKQYPLLFYAGLGLFQTYVAGLLNIASTAQIKFPWFYWEPLVYAGLIWADYTRIMGGDKVAIGYGLLVAVVMVKYVAFLWSMITQLTKHLGIHLLRVKEKTVDKKTQ